MNIYIDGRALFKNPGGVNVTVVKLIEGLAKQGLSHKIYVVGFKNQKADHTPLKRVEYVWLPFHQKIYSAVFKFIKPISVNRWLPSKPDVVFYPNFIAFPWIKSAPKLALVHDTVHIDIPEVVEDKNLKYLNKFIPWQVKKGVRLAGTSRFVMEQLAKAYSLGIDQIIRIPLGVELSKSKKQAELSKVREKYKIDKNYLLFVGTIQPRKNIKRTVEAYTLLPQQIRDKYQLVLAGAPGWKKEDIMFYIKTRQDSGMNVKVTGFIDQSDLDALYQGAELLVFPSLYEGYGLPILEAMKNSTPVICADNSAQSELAKDAAIFADPDSAKDISEQIVRVVNNPDLRKDLIKVGKTRSMEYSWDKATDMLIKALEEL